MISALMLMKAGNVTLGILVLVALVALALPDQSSGRIPTATSPF